MNIDEKHVYPNGVNPADGLPLVPSIQVGTLATWIYEQVKSQKHKPLAWLNLANKLHKLFTQKSLGVRLKYQGKENDPSQVGWGVIFTPSTPPDVRTTIQQLADHRGSAWKLRDYQPGESAYDYRMEYNQDFGPVDPEKMPYYLLLVGSPQEMPFSFQCDLDAQHAVGRLYFDTPAGYQSYVERLIAYEKAAASSRTRQVGIFSPDSDPQMYLSSYYLATPLAGHLDHLTLQTPSGSSYTYQRDWKNAAAATQAVLSDWITQGQASLLFSATHGARLSGSSPDLLRMQGAVQCQSAYKAPVYVSGDAIPASADLSGLVYFAFACFGAGSPKENTFYRLEKKVNSQAPAQNAPYPFISYLPQRLLAQGALAFIGHVDQTWSYSYGWPGKTTSLTQNYEDTLDAILQGRPVGHALDPFNMRYLDLHNALYQDEGAIAAFYNSEPGAGSKLVDLWTARLDARNIILLGDPASHLRPEILS
jgi:hypothetical protein